MQITPIYAALFAFMFIWLSIRTIKFRRKHKVALGDGGQVELNRAIRAHANFAEYVPFTLLLIAMLETISNQPVIIHGLCLVLLLGRVVHAYSVSHVNEIIRLRVIGMLLTFTSLGLAALGILIFKLIIN